MGPASATIATFSSKTSPDHKASSGSNSNAMAPAAQKTRKRSTRSDKPAKDPELPKKPVGGAYGVFLAENREEIMKTAGRRGPDVAKLAASRWKAMTEEDKTEYQKKYQEKREAYEVSKKEYEESHSKGQDQPSAASTATRSTTTPKKRSAKRSAPGSASDEQQSSEPPSSTKESKKDKEAKSKELGPMEMAEQARKRRCLHQRAQKLGLLEKMFALSKELSELQGVNDNKILAMLEKSAGMMDVAKRRLLGEL